MDFTLGKIAASVGSNDHLILFLPLSKSEKKNNLFSIIQLGFLGKNLEDSFELQDHMEKNKSYKGILVFFFESSIFTKII